MCQIYCTWARPPPLRLPVECVNEGAARVMRIRRRPMASLFRMHLREGV